MTSLINQSIKFLNKTADFDLKIQKFREKLLNINADVEDLIFELNAYLQDIENYESNLPEIQKRLFFLKNLERTYGMDLNQLIDKRDKLKNYFLRNDHDNEICTMQDQLKNFQSNLNTLFVIQSNERKKIAKQLQDSVTFVLRNLGLENAKFVIQFSQGTPSCDGIDNIDFLTIDRASVLITFEKRVSKAGFDDYFYPRPVASNVSTTTTTTTTTTLLDNQTSSSQSPAAIFLEKYG